MTDLKERKEELLKRSKELFLLLEDYNSIKREKHSIDSEIQDINYKIEKNKNSFYIGHFFKAIEKYEGIEAFKIIDVLDPPNEKYALCLCVTCGDSNNAFENYSKGIRMLVVPLWVPASWRMISKKDNKKVIDQYEEIDKEKFTNIYTNMQKTLSENL